MATVGATILRLPSSLRQHLVLQQPARLGQLLHATGHQISRRSFQSAIRLDRGKTLDAASKQTTRSARTQPHQQLPQARPHPRPAPSAPPPRESPPLNADRTILLYTAPNHGAFFASSFIIGGAFILGAYTYAQAVLKDSAPDGSNQTWYIKSLGGISVLSVVGFGTVFLLAPQKMIKSIAVVSKQASIVNAVAPISRLPRTLRIEVKRTLPFVKPDVIEAKAADVALDRNVPDVLRNLSFMSVSKDNAILWTKDYLAGKFKPDPTPKGILGSIRAIWPATKREVRRMFLRDQMARVYVKNNGSYKLDLRKCCMLDEGRALSAVLGDRIMTDMSLISRLAALIRP